MTASGHPSLEDLLLWQSGELSPEQAAEIAAHVAGCPQCKKDVSDTGDLFGEVASINAEAAQWQMHRRLDAEQRTTWLSRLIHPVRRGWIPASAAVLIVALVLYTMSDLTPEARADALLASAVRQENSLTVEPRFVSLDIGGSHCFAEAGSTEGHLLPTSSSNSCHALSDKLQNASWSYHDLLSAKGFQSWRAKLHKKTDSIHKSAAETEIRTSTENSSIHVATLRLRNSDLRPVGESLEFASAQDEPATTVQIAEAAPAEIAALSAPSAPAIAAPPKAIVAAHLAPAISSLDLAEAHALLALHDLGADKNVLVDVQREPDGVKVWGVASSDAQKNAIVTALNGVPDVTAAVRSQQEAKQSPQSLPWQPYRGDGPPLAQPQLQSLFPNNPQGLQEFVNSLDKTTLELAAEARNRDALLALAKRLSTTAESASLDHAAESLQQQMAAQVASLSHQLQPLTGPVTPENAPGNAVLTYLQAAELYTLVHQVAYMSDSQAPVTLDDALSRIRRLLSMR